jgi:lysozyme
MTIAFTPGLDASSWQDDRNTPQEIDWSKVIAGGKKFALIRASYGGVIDREIGYNWPAAKAVGLIRGAYGFYNYWGGQPSPESQAQTLLAAIGNDLGEIPVILDFERPDESFPALPVRSACLSVIQTYFNIVDAAIGRPTMLYTNSATLKYLSPLPDWLIAHPLWVAAWPFRLPDESPEHAVERTGYRPVTYGWPWTFWQYSNKGNGKALGMESYDVDVDYFNGSEEELRVFARVIPAPPSQDERITALEQEVAALQEWARGWNFTG